MLQNQIAWTTAASCRQNSSSFLSVFFFFFFSVPLCFCFFFPHFTSCGAELCCIFFFLPGPGSTRLTDGEIESGCQIIGTEFANNHNVLTTTNRAEPKCAQKHSAHTVAEPNKTSRAGTCILDLEKEKRETSQPSETDVSKRNEPAWIHSERQYLRDQWWLCLWDRMVIQGTPSVPDKSCMRKVAEWKGEKTAPRPNERGKGVIFDRYAHLYLSGNPLRN